MASGRASAARRVRRVMGGSSGWSCAHHRAARARRHLPSRRPVREARHRHEGSRAVGRAGQVGASRQRLDARQAFWRQGGDEGARDALAGQPGLPPIGEILEVLADHDVALGHVAQAGDGEQGSQPAGRADGVAPVARAERLAIRFGAATLSAKSAQEGEAAGEVPHGGGDDAAWLRHPRQFRHRGRAVGHELQHEQRQRGIEGAVGHPAGG